MAAHRQALLRLSDRATRVAQQVGWALEVLEYAKNFAMKSGD
jgi:hypothetical protein